MWANVVVESISPQGQEALSSAQVGYLRRGRYNKGKRVGKAVMLQAVRHLSLLAADSITETRDVWLGWQQGCSSLHCELV